ncbi:hypothetical protein HDU76_002829 [Blyttiomyces sp. JEL0837]|nr:hypothetical protein HDU76_002829 [Blyttiomyces sp. JEL0837]
MNQGHETTASTLAFAMGNLALHPEMQEALYKDVKRVIGNDEVPSFKHFNDLAYAMAVMNETLRLHSPVSVIPKWTGENQAILGPYILPPKTKVNVYVPALHTHPDIWGSDALEFRPERWLDGAVADDYKETHDHETPEHRVLSGIPSRYKNAFVPFSEGPRGCLGRKFAQLGGETWD